MQLKMVLFLTQKLWFYTYLLSFISSLLLQLNIYKYFSTTLADNHEETTCNNKNIYDLLVYNNIIYNNTIYYKTNNNHILMLLTLEN